MATKDEVAQLIVGEAKVRNHSREECLAEMSALYQESQWDETIWDRTHVTYGVAQQDGSYAHRFEGAAAQIRAFFDKLDVKRASPGHGDIWLNICWLQQAPNWSSAQYWYDHGRRAYLSEIKSRIATVTPYLDKYWPPTPGGIAEEKPMVGWKGDPVWLADVLRAEGLRCDIYPGAFDRGHGDMDDIWGVVAHHTGNNNASAQSIAEHPELGLASQLHLSREGVYTLCGVGVAWHAGAGSYPTLGTNNANPRTIGIEAANDGGGAPGKPHRSSWPDVQYDAYVRGVAAILRKIGFHSDRVIGHKEWAGKAQGKWDPGAIDMNVFRADVQSHIVSAPPAAPPPPAGPQKVGPGEDQLTYRWNQLGGQTLVEAVAQIRDKVCSTNDAGKPGAK